MPPLRGVTGVTGLPSASALDLQRRQELENFIRQLQQQRAQEARSRSAFSEVGGPVTRAETTITPDPVKQQAQLSGRPLLDALAQRRQIPGTPTTFPGRPQPSGLPGRGTLGRLPGPADVPIPTGPGRGAPPLRPTRQGAPPTETFASGGSGLFRQTKGPGRPPRSAPPPSIESQAPGGGRLSTADVFREIEAAQAKPSVKGDPVASVQAGINVGRNILLPAIEGGIKKTPLGLQNSLKISSVFKTRKSPLEDILNLFGRGFPGPFD